METGIPLHPMIVHLPLGLAMALPFISAAFFYLIKKEIFPSESWWMPVIVQAVVVIFTFTAIQLGERDEELVEKVVAEEYLEQHEDAGKIFLILGIASLVTMSAAIKKTKFQKALHFCSVLLLFGSLGGGVYTGKLGGELVYKHGAAGVYAQSDKSSTPIPDVKKETKLQKNDD
jgi:uncharacterized membrane protein